VTLDIDERARELLREIDRVENNSNEYTASAVLHTSDQKFPTKVRPDGYSPLSRHGLCMQQHVVWCASRAAIASTSIPVGRVTMLA
jgi:hypothetical protein